MDHLSLWEGIVHDLTGAGQVRLFLQPAMALFLGIRLGIIDANEGRPPFLLRLFTSEHGRWQLFKRSLSDAVLPLCMAFVVDVVLQRITLGYVRPLGAVFVGALLVWLPFVVSRALTNRIVTRKRLRRGPALAG